MDSLELAHRSFARELWALCYRMTGVAADADELVQDTFVRALEHQPPVSTESPLRPWLFSVATRLCIDRLRKRRSLGYVGPWLPSPVDNDSLTCDAPASARYEVMESASVAFLIALEALSPEQRAALVLGDVFDESTLDIAKALETSEANVRQLRHRARQALQQYDAARQPIDSASTARSRALLEGFFGALVNKDTQAARTFLSADVRCLSDGGGKYHAALQPVSGVDRTVLFYSRLIETRGLPLKTEFRLFNGLWCLDSTLLVKHPKDAPRSITGLCLDREGRMGLLYTVMAPAKMPTLSAQ